jgi:large subunit ribosomal protein L1
MPSSKRYKKALTQVDVTKTYPLPQAVEVLQKFPKAKFNETVDLAFRLGVDPKQSDQMVRGTVPLPHGSGKTVKVLVFAKPGNAADAARAAGAEFVGFDDMIKKCNEGWTDFDVAIATPEAMGEVRKLGKVLGPRGLMPNPKTGTVTDDTAKAPFAKSKPAAWNSRWIKPATFTSRSAKPISRPNTSSITHAQSSKPSPKPVRRR